MAFLPPHWQIAGFLEPTSTRGQVSRFARGPAYLAFFDRLLAEIGHPSNTPWQQCRLLMLAARHLDEWWSLQNKVADEQHSLAAMAQRRLALEHVGQALLEQRMKPYLIWIPIQDWNPEQRDHALAWAQLAFKDIPSPLKNKPHLHKDGNQGTLWLLLRHHRKIVPWPIPSHLPRWIPLVPQPLPGDGATPLSPSTLPIACLEHVASCWLTQFADIEIMGVLRCLVAGEFEANNHKEKEKEKSKNKEKEHDKNDDKPYGIRACEWHGDLRFLQAWRSQYLPRTCAIMPVTWPKWVDLGQLLQLPHIAHLAPTPAKASYFAVHRHDLLTTLFQEDRLLHQPYDSFATVLDCLAAASEDPQVSHIFQTIYRVEKQSAMVHLLAMAAKRNKKVTVVIECRARGDEQHNRMIAHTLQQAGAHVLCPTHALKHHGKAMLIQGTWQGQQRRICHLGTGNYHAETSTAYTDISLLTSHPEITQDLYEIFIHLQHQRYNVNTQQLITAPYQLLPFVLAQIQAEILAHREQRQGAIMCKINGLTDPIVIQALLHASQEGVPIRLLVRGPCNLRPGVPGISPTIEVRSIVGQHLEHARLYGFGLGARARLYCSSADWMTRNLRERFEIAFPILHPEFQAQLRYEAMELYWQDNRNAWDLQPEGHYQPAWTPHQPIYCAQHMLHALRDLPWWFTQNNASTPTKGSVHSSPALLHPDPLAPHKPSSSTCD